MSVGDILSVPFGAQQVGAIAVRLLQILPADLDDKQIRSVTSIVNPGMFSATYWRLLEQVAEYYQTPLIQVIKTALPPGLLGRSQRRVRLLPTEIPPDAALFLSPVAACVLQQLQQSANGDYTWQYLKQQCRGAVRGIQALVDRQWAESYLALPTPPQPKRRQAVTVVQVPTADERSLTPRQREVVILLQRHGGDLWLQEALQLCRTTSATLRSLAAKGYLAIEEREILRQMVGPPVTTDQPKILTLAQQTALEILQSLQGEALCLLHGVTGSGKTEVYLQAIAPQLAVGRSALVLVPEIGLTPQLTDRFRQRFGERVCVYHSGLSDGERYDAWRHMLQGEPRVVIGTRSAVFAPLPRLGILILDEEHDASFKQDQPMPCYHARTVARWRSQLEGCPLILGSATPSLESWVEVRSPAAMSLSSTPQDGAQPAVRHYLVLPERIHRRSPPPVTVVDMRQELQAGNRSILSRTLRSALETMKVRDEQGILFIQRRGHSSFVSCRACGHVMMCPHCDVSLSFHQASVESVPLLRCHYCSFGQVQPPTCPACASPYLKHFGSGTQRVEQVLAQELPEIRCLRFDSDTTRTKGSHRALLSRFALGEADVLVGTQMLTKGIDLPQVTVVGVIAADGLLYMADYRANERAFQILTQVAGRAGRGDQPGRVILQTYTPENPVVDAVQRQDVTAFLDTELSQRQPLNYPPTGRLILLRVTSPYREAAEQTAQDLVAQLTPSLAAEWTVLGPVPAPILRIAQRYRWQILLKGEIAAPLPDLTYLHRACPKAVSLTIDVDPLNMM